MLDTTLKSFIIQAIDEYSTVSSKSKFILMRNTEKLREILEDEEGDN